MVAVLTRAGQRLRRRFSRQLHQAQTVADDENRQVRGLIVLAPIPKNCRTGLLPKGLTTQLNSTIKANKGGLMDVARPRANTI